MSNATEVAREILQGPKPISIEISTQDVQMLYACQTSPTAYMQLILAKFKDAGAPVEGTLNLKLAHGMVCKLKDNPLQEQIAFTYLWLPEAYVDGMRNIGQA
jgi:hypothetical protein